jgi:aromatic ring hydroxylase
MTEENNPKKIVSGDDYISSLRNRGLKVYFFGEEVEEPVDNKIKLFLYSILNY